MSRPGARGAAEVAFVLVCLLAVALLQGGAIALDPDWPTWRGDGTRAASRGEAGDGMPSLLWKRQLGNGTVTGSPAIASGRVFASGADGEIVAFHPTSGAPLWKVRMKQPIVGSPIVSGGTLYVGTGDGVSGRGGALVAIDALSGEILWTQLEGRGVRATPTVSDGLVLYGARDPGNDATGDVVARDALTGGERWRFQAPSFVDVSPLAAVGSNGPLVVSGGADGRVYGLGAPTGAERWRFATGGPIEALAETGGGVVLAASRDGYVYALVLETGELLWKYRVGTGAATDVSIRPSAGHAYVRDAAGTVHAIALSTGLAVWSAPLNGTAAPAVAGTTLLLLTEDRDVLALTAATGDERWRFRLGDVGSAGPVVRDGVVYAGARDGALYAVSLLVDDGAGDISVVDGAQEAAAGPSEGSDRNARAQGNQADPTERHSAAWAALLLVVTLVVGLVCALPWLR